MPTFIDGVSKIPVSGLGVRLANPVAASAFFLPYSPKCVEQEFSEVRLEACERWPMFASSYGIDTVFTTLRWGARGGVGTMARAGEQLYDPVQGDSIEFRETARDTGGGLVSGGWAA